MADYIGNTDEVIAKEITIAVVSNMEIQKLVTVEDIPAYVSDLYKTILKSVKNPN